jgi:phosphatidylglycerol---prolipoprotein diacylglyceryl transferase
LIPYIHFYDLGLGLARIHPFGLLVAFGTLLGIALAKRRGRSVGVSAPLLASFIAWMLVAGFVGGHVLDEISYHPHELVQRPWSLLYLWAGLSSFGGFVGALVGVTLWKYYELRPAFHIGPWISVMRPMRRAQPIPILPFCDVILSVFPVAWIFGRMGCAVVHDHPGVRAPAWFPMSVAYGPGPIETFGSFELRFGNTPRYDLGLLEMLFACVVAGAFALSWRKRRPIGWYAAVLPLAYAPMRFALDFLRLQDSEGGDLRYASLTPAQWACIALFCVGLTVAARLVQRPRFI